MKKGCWILILMLGSLSSLKAQLEAPEKPVGFDPARVFIGTSLNLGLSNRFFNLGLNPEVGYSLNNWLDIGVAMNLNYYSQSATGFNTIKYKNINFGGGAFLRVWPISFLHLQIQPEYNWISSSQTDVNTGQTFKYKLQAPSMLAGIGYGTREIGNRFSHFTIMIDLNQAINSPYRDQFGDPQPVFRGGFGMYLNARKR
ncbi:hypothetical protein [Sediminibacterium sp.]|uniref:hypothetical protein n=1 Tax=Sediminibacterium sp. TaxID=1917865 RepID=UPI0025F1CD07|nr:hypothetical protein [Sediminibacterium sp.]MBT9483717.1 hypothetical protein [Sediminibacterium sp.]